MSGGATGLGVAPEPGGDASPIATVLSVRTAGGARRAQI